MHWIRPRSPNAFLIWQETKALKKTRASGRNVSKVFNPVVKLVLENQPFPMMYHLQDVSTTQGSLSTTPKLTKTSGWLKRPARDTYIINSCVMLKNMSSVHAGTIT